MCKLREAIRLECLLYFYNKNLLSSSSPYKLIAFHLFECMLSITIVATSQASWIRCKPIIQ